MRQTITLTVAFAIHPNVSDSLLQSRTSDFLGSNSYSDFACGSCGNSSAFLHGRHSTDHFVHRTCTSSDTERGSIRFASIHSDEAVLREQLRWRS